MTVKNFIIISPHFPENFQTFARSLKNKGLNVLGIADEDYFNLNENLRNNLTEYYKVNSMESYDEMYRAVAFFAFKYGKIDRIESFSEHWIELEAKLREDFNVFGFKPSDMKYIKSKSEMKKKFIEFDVPNAKGRLVSNKEDMLSFTKDVGFPIIVKPDRGVGATNTFRIKSKEDTDNFFENTDLSHPYIMEEFIEGEIYTFDGLTDRDGSIVFYSTNVFPLPMLDVVEGSNMFYYMEKDIPKELVDLGEKCVEAFNVKERFFHFEFFKKKSDGKFMVIEVNCRVPGGQTIDMFNYANDFDIFDQYANIVKENKFTANIPRNNYVIYISRKPEFNYKHTIDEIKARYWNDIYEYFEPSPLFVKVMGNNAFVIRANDMDDIKEKYEFILA